MSFGVTFTGHGNEEAVAAAIAGATAAIIAAGAEFTVQGNIGEQTITESHAARQSEATPEDLAQAETGDAADATEAPGAPF